MTEHTQSNTINGATTLHHKLIDLPAGKAASDVVGERHEMVLLIEVAKSNPNGDPDTGNMPRLQPDTLKGLMTDVCLKRKVRNFFSLYNPDGSCLGETPQQGNAIFIRENAILQKLMEAPEIEKLAREIFEKELNQKAESWDAKKKRAGSKGKKQQQKIASDDVTEMPEEEASPADEFKKRAYRDALCRQYYDLRAFGGVTSTEGPLIGSFFGQIRGPIQFSFAESLDPILQLDFTITRCASTKEKPKGEGESSGKEKENRTMGRKHMVDYGIYRSHIYCSPAFAAKTGFTYYDLDNFLFALKHMFTDDKAAARAGMRVVGLIDFQHSTALGNEHAHKLFEMVKVRRSDVNEQGKSKKEFPQSMADYCGEAPEGTVREKDQGGEGKELVKALKIIWEIPACQKENPTAQA